MDTKTLIAICVTIVVTEIAKRLVPAMIGWLKSSTIASTVSDGAAEWRNSPALNVFADVAGLAFIVYFAVDTFLVAGPANKSDLLTLFSLTLGAIFFAGSLIFDSIQLSLKKLMRRA